MAEIYTESEAAEERVYTAKILYRKLEKKIFPVRKLRGLNPNF
jgi:hypothetical protein